MRVWFQRCRKFKHIKFCPKCFIIVCKPKSARYIAVHEFAVNFKIAIRSGFFGSNEGRRKVSVGRRITAGWLVFTRPKLHRPVSNDNVFFSEETWCATEPGIIDDVPSISSQPNICRGFVEFIGHFPILFPVIAWTGIYRW